MNHADLVEIAVKWLRNGARVPDSSSRTGERRRNCGVVLSEMVTSTMETPDAIGWFLAGDRSVLVECKATRPDFLADKRKMFRRHKSWGCGDYRYFLAPDGLIANHEVPVGWGLLNPIGNGRVKLVMLATRMDKNKRAETNMLWSAVRRLQNGGESYCKPIRSRSSSSSS